ncbi:MAG: argininosuccinate lyase, partial [Pseudomonadota bacterium]|nr:argininosuccinate lyase [Pseudomonadota bacterium]
RFQQVTSARHFVEMRNRPGGPAPEALGAALTQYQSTLTELITEHRARNQRHSDARTALDTAFMSYVET